MLVARSSPGGLGLAADPRFIYPPHIELIDGAIVDALAGEIPPRIIVETPPRHGKSELISRWTPAWFVGTYPDKRVMLGSYEYDFAASWGRRARTILQEFGPSVFGIAVTEDSRARNRWEARQSWTPDDPDLLDWETPGGGGMLTAGVGGAFTGKGADLLIIDDPIKNAAEAQSQTFRDKIWEWFLSTAFTRLEPGGVCIVVMTRWHEDDLIGRLLTTEETGAEPWHRIRLPALAEADDAIGRAIGEALWPDRYDEVALKKIEAALGARLFGSLYQQRPAPAAGDIFNKAWWRSYSAPPRVFHEVLQSWDMSFKDTKSSSFVVGQVWGRLGANKYLLGQVRGRMNFPATKRAVRALNDWCNERGWTGIRKLVEDKANGPAIISELRSEIEGLVPVSVETSKVARATAITPQVEGHNVYLPRGVIPSPDGYEPTTTEAYVAEHTAFPNGANDDQVDATSQALDRWISRAVATVNGTEGGGDSLTGDLLEKEM